MKISDLEQSGNSRQLVQQWYPSLVPLDQEKIFELKSFCFTVDVVITIRIKFRHSIRFVNIYPLCRDLPSG